ncbi:MAG: GNAT family N-acetyltransferase [Phycisphaerales bacterium]|nr:GNAT family N-acetyltransferase [Phycisphaerales bacterium]
MTVRCDLFSDVSCDTVGLDWLLVHRPQRLQMIGEHAGQIGNETDLYFGGDPGDPGVTDALRALPCGAMVHIPASWEGLLHHAWDGHTARIERLEWSRRDGRPAQLAATRPVTPLDAHAIVLLSETGLDRLVGPYDTIDEFLSLSFGFAVIEQGKVIAAATAYYIADDRADLAVETYSPFRRRGLGAAVLAVVAAEAQVRGLSPVMHAGVCSTAAIHLARAVGFVKPTTFAAHARTG